MALVKECLREEDFTADWRDMCSARRNLVSAFSTPVARAMPKGTSHRDLPAMVRGAPAILSDQVVLPADPRTRYGALQNLARAFPTVVPRAMPKIVSHRTSHAKACPPWPLMPPPDKQHTHLSRYPT